MFKAKSPNNNNDNNGNNHNILRQSQTERKITYSIYGKLLAWASRGTNSRAMIGMATRAGTIGLSCALANASWSQLCPVRNSALYVL